MKPNFHRVRLAAACGLFALTVAPAHATGLALDCNNDGRTTIDELVRGVNIVLSGNHPPAPPSCLNADADGNGEVNIVDLIRGVNAALGTSLTDPKVVFNPNDQTIVQTTDDGGNMVEFFGTKDGQGHATSLESARTARPEGNVTIDVDAAGLPSKIHLPSGGMFTMSWVGSRVHVTGLTADRANEAAFSRPLTGDIGTALGGSGGASGGGGSGGSRVRVNVSRCNKPATNAHVRFLVTEDTGSSSFTDVVEAVHDGNGQYSALLPRFQVDIPGAAELEAICSAGSSVVKPMCKAVKLLGQGPGGGVAFCTALATVAPELYPECLVVIESLRAACQPLNRLPDPEPALDCGRVQEAVQHLFDHTTTIQPLVHVPDLSGQFDAPPQSVTGATAPLPSFTVTLPSQVRVSALVADGAHSCSGVPGGYCIEAYLSCIPPGGAPVDFLVDRYPDPTAPGHHFESHCRLFLDDAGCGVGAVFAPSDVDYDRILVGLPTGLVRRFFYFWDY
jgi:hypothetical protein